ncbi:TetR/AcrR family transcriptional regulator [Nocardia sp. NPDC059240]|uniref:TetR/AcrR family transcriptional regulator n=1 Tax=Nocardia sp. NPDC059240 TaxID=3346786 RepID=UPI00369978AA
MESATFDLSDMFGVALRLSDEDRRLLDSARAVFITHGFRRTTIDDIARRAGVTRRTVNRRLGDKDRIVRGVIAREVTAFFTDNAERFTAFDSPTERTIEAFTAGIVAFHRNPVAQAAIRFEPETLTAMLDPATDGWFTQLRDLVAGQLAYAMNWDEAQRITELILRITVSLIISPSDVLPVRTETEARWFANNVFVPLIEHGLPGPANP